MPTQLSDPHPLCMIRWRVPSMASLLVAGRIDGIHRLAHRWHPVVASDVILTVTNGPNENNVRCKQYSGLPVRAGSLREFPGGQAAPNRGLVAESNTYEC